MSRVWHVWGCFHDHQKALDGNENEKSNAGLLKGCKSQNYIRVFNTIIILKKERLYYTYDIINVVLPLILIFKEKLKTTVDFSP